MTDDGVKAVDLTANDDSPPAEGEKKGNTIASGENVDAGRRVNAGDASHDLEMNGYNAENTETEDPKGDSPPSVLTTRKGSGSTRASKSEGTRVNLEIKSEAEADIVEDTQMRDPKGLSSLDGERILKNERKRPCKGSTDLGDSDGKVDTDNGNSSVDRSKRARMDEPKPSEKSNSGRWNEMFDRLVVYKEQFGDCRVPNRFELDPTLGFWVSAQRRLSKSGQEEDSVNAERIRKLNDIEFCWESSSARHVPWDVRYEELRDYVRRFGNAQVPVRWKENMQLSNWVSKQRHDFKLRRRGTSMRLTDERYRKLSDLGFVWDANGNEQGLPSPQDTMGLSDKSSGKEIGSSESSGAVEDRNPQSHFPGGNHARDQTGGAIDVNTIEAALKSKLVVDPDGLLEAARINSWRLQMSGLAPTGTVGASNLLSPGELMTLPLPVTTTLAFIPVLRTVPALHMPAPPYGIAGMHSMMPQAATGPFMSGATLGQRFNPHRPSGSNTSRANTLPDHLIQAHGANMENKRPGRTHGDRDRTDIDERPRRGWERRTDPPEN